MMNSLHNTVTVSRVSRKNGPSFTQFHDPPRETTKVSKSNVFYTVSYSPILRLGYSRETITLVKLLRSTGMPFHSFTSFTTKYVIPKKLNLAIDKNINLC